MASAHRTLTGTPARGVMGTARPGAAVLPRVLGAAHRLPCLCGELRSSCPAALLMGEGPAPGRAAGQGRLPLPSMVVHVSVGCCRAASRRFRSEAIIRSISSRKRSRNGTTRCMFSACRQAVIRATMARSKVSS
jgi:hypothetical protein